MALTARQRRAEEKKRAAVARDLEWPGGKIGGWEIRCPNGHTTVRSFTQHKRKLGSVAVSWSCSTCGESFGKRTACIHCAKTNGEHADWCPTGRNIADYKRLDTL